MLILVILKISNTILLMDVGLVLIKVRNEMTFFAFYKI